MGNILERTFFFFGCIAPALAIACVDVKKQIIPDKITCPMIALGLLYALATGKIMDALAGAAICFGLFFFVGLLGGVGGGDLKFATALGTWFGFYGSLTVIFLASVLGLAWGVVKMLRARGLGETLGWFKGTLFGFWLMARGQRDNPFLPRLPEDDDEPAPDTALPFGAFLAAAVLLVWLGSPKI
ncbi:MAG: A24 family peptidase [Peptococcaceae bacterium]|nr:A24 family peptidase [Peptococcaceae bacterium]